MRTLKKKSDLPSWFDLSIYQKPLSAEQWLHQLVIRYSIKLVFRNGMSTEEAKLKFVELIRSEPKVDLIDSKKEVRHLWGVKVLSLYEAAYVAAMLMSTLKGKQLIEEIQTARSARDIFNLLDLKKGMDKDWTEVVDWDSEPFRVTDALPNLPISIDLEQDDESLKAAFSIFLAGTKEEDRITKPFSDKDLQDWYTFGVLPVFDLTFWGELNDIKYTDNLIAASVWPNEEVDVTERLRKVTRPKVNQLFGSWELIGRLWKQLELYEAMKHKFGPLLESNPSLSGSGMKCIAKRSGI